MNNKHENKNVMAGTVYNAIHIKQSFEVTNDANQTVKGFDKWSNTNFTGKPAKRIPDGKLALVALIQKPPDYPYDFVLL